MTQSPDNLKVRDVSLDVFRGILCLTTVAIHVFGDIMTHAKRESGLWTVFAAANPILLYAVPGFLLLSCLLSIGKLLQPYSLRDYTMKRVHGIVIPYLIWSLFYIALMSIQPPPNFEVKDALSKVLYGKSVGHLYYLGVMIQLSILLPFIAPLFKKRIPAPLLLIVTIALTLAMYWLNRLVLHLPYLASVVFWHIPAIAVGCWLGVHLTRLEERLRPAFPYLLITAIVALSVYLPLALRVLARRDADTFVFQIAEWTYTATAAVLLLLTARRISTSRLRKPLARLGDYSMQVYLMHPLFLYAAIKVFPPKTPELLPFAIVLYFAASIGLSLGLAKLFERVKLSPLLFGR